MFPTLYIGNWSVSTYWLMFAIGVAGMAIICSIRAKQYRLSRVNAIIFSLLLAVSGLLGTKILYVLENWQETLEEGLTLGGQSFFGALFLVPLAVSLYGQIFGLRPKQSMDLCAPAVIFILMCMRTGCMLNGCCGGICLYGVNVPTQFIEAIGDAGIFAYLLYKESAGKHYGLLYPWLMLLYGALRFCVEFFRATPKEWFFLSHGQWFSMVAFFAAALWLCKKGGLRYEQK